MRKLAVIAPRYPSLLERVLLGIICIGFCDGNKPEYVQACHRACVTRRFLNGRASKQLTP